MKPCCYAAEQRCVDIANPWDEWSCEEYGGVLGPEGACCHNPIDGSCTAPEQRCWRCLWEVEHPDDIQSCCFRPGLSLAYQWFPEITFEQCRLCDGTLTLTQEECAPPSPPALRPCCVGFGLCQNVSPSQESQCVSDGGTLGPTGTCCQNPLGQPFCEHNTCWRCDWGAEEMASPCCFADLNYQWFGNIPWQQCWACDGEIMNIDAVEEECQPPVPEPECIDAPRADRPNPTIIDFEGTRLQWTIDTIGTVVFGRSGTDDVLEGYQYPISAHLIRPKQADTPAESCGHAGGRMTMLDDGYVYVETCSKPDRTSEDSFRRSYGLMRTFLPEKDTPLAQANRALGVQDGYQYSVACIRLPWWTEALYRSHMARCGGDPL